MDDPVYSPETTDALISAIPDNPYDPCPCGCGKKWRYVIREGEQEIEKHAKTFCDKYIKEHLI